MASDVRVLTRRGAAMAEWFDAVAQLRRTFNAPIPSLLITGDTTTDRMREAGSSGLLLLHKPVSPMTLRATVNQILRSNGNTGRRPRAAIPSAGP